MQYKKILIILAIIILAPVSLAALTGDSFYGAKLQQTINLKVHSSSKLSSKVVSSSSNIVSSSAIQSQVSSSSKPTVVKTPSSKKPVNKAPPLPTLTYLNVKDLPDNNITTDISTPSINNDMVNLQSFIPNITVNLHYATQDNFTKQVIYDFTKAYLRRATALKLKAASAELNSLGYTLEIWDAYRPPAAQFKLWNAYPDPSFVADPNTTHSNHSCGCAIDITLMKDGVEILMPSAFDQFGATADRDYSDVTPEAAANATLLETTLKKYDLVPYKNEWWHFDDSVKYDPITFDPNSDSSTIIDINSVGDCVLGNDYRVNPKLSFNYYLDTLKKPTTYFLQNFRDTFINDDLTIANAENCFTNSTNRVQKPNQPTGTFWLVGRPSNVHIFKDNGIDAVSIANNHSLDFGTDEFINSVKNLSNVGVSTFGYGNFTIVEKKGIKIGMLSYNLLGPFELGVDLNAMKSLISKELNIMSIYANIKIISFHFGDEGSNSPNSVQQDMAHFAIDSGADLVLGTHPHFIQPVEEYKGRVIAYSLANFCYGGAVTSTNNISFILNTKFTMNENKDIVSCADSVIPIFTNDLPYNNYCPSLATEPAYSQIMRLTGKQT